MQLIRRYATRLLMLGAVAVLGFHTASARDHEHTTGPFKGPKANTGVAIHFVDGKKSMLKVSDDFQVPDTPAPTWRVVDSKGNIHTLQAFKLKDNKVNRQIMVPSYVHDIAKVQVYCAWAEVLLGEAAFPAPVK